MHRSCAVVVFQFPNWAYEWYECSAQISFDFILFSSFSSYSTVFISFAANILFIFTHKAFQVKFSSFLWSFERFYLYFVYCSLFLKCFEYKLRRKGHFRLLDNFMSYDHRTIYEEKRLEPMTIILWKVNAECNQTEQSWRVSQSHSWTVFNPIRQ